MKNPPSHNAPEAPDAILRRNRLIRRFSLAALVLFCCAGAGIFWYVRASAGGKKQAAAARTQSGADRTYTVKRDHLVLGLMLSGSVNASKKHKMSLQANFKTKLLHVVDENTRVKAGDVLARCETEELRDRISDLRTELGNLEQELMIAHESEKIQKSSNDVDIESAVDKLKQAEEAMRKYRRFERAKQRDQIMLKITNAETASETAESDYDKAKQTASETPTSNAEDAEKQQQELDKLSNTIDTKSNELKNAKLERKLFVRFDHPMKIRRLESDLRQARLNLDKVRVSAASNLVQKKKQIDNLRNRIRRVRLQLERHESYMPLMVLKAPVDGVVIYGDPDRRWGNPDVKPGIDVWKSLVLLTIPEMNNLVVDFELPEQFRSKTRVGDRVIITPDSLPTLKVRGFVSKIATLPVNQISWDSASPKVYISRITLDAQNPRLVSGMSVQLEVVTRVIKKTLFVPVEAVFERASRFFVYKQTIGGPKEVTVKIGESNNNFVQINEGIAEGDVVYLYRPYQGRQSSQQ